MTSPQNNCSKQQQTLPGKLASVFEKDFTTDALPSRKLRKGKIKALKGKKNYNTNANIDVNADAGAEISKWPIWKLSSQIKFAKHSK